MQGDGYALQDNILDLISCFFPAGEEIQPQSIWAGQFIKPYPDERPNYFTDHNGPAEWDYADHCNTWDHYRTVHRF